MTPETSKPGWILSPIAFDGTRTPVKTALFLVVCLAWLLPGLLGHDPWKTDEALAFGAVGEMLRTGDWMRFAIAGEPVVGEPPLFLWTAAAFAHALGGLLPLHDAARLAAGLYMGIVLALVSAASWELMGERAVRMSVLLLIGCLGLLLRAHEMTPELSGLAGAALALYGLTLTRRRTWLAGVLAGAGIGVGYLGNGLIGAGMLVATMAALPLASPAWRDRGYAQVAGIAALCALPFVLAWPAGLAGDPTHGSTRGLGYFLKQLTWYAWPAWPLAAWTLWRARRDLATRVELHLPLIAFAVFFLFIAIFAESRDIAMLPLLLPLAMLGVAELEALPRGGASALDWFGVMTFFLIGLLIWIAWGAALTGSPEAVALYIQREIPGFTYRFNFLAFALAALLTLVWVVVVARSLRSPRRALVNWAAGITMVWMLLMTLGVPIVDQARTYRHVAARVAAAIPRDAGCVARKDMGDAQRALLYYFAKVRTVPVDLPVADTCGALLVQAHPQRVPPAGAEWAEVWRGSRTGDRNEVFILYRRAKA
jgi:4-amino-4-deoxy-L-arabinose transferase-like glycosyltransferase